jgi:hypothetical protein
VELLQLMKGSRQAQHALPSRLLLYATDGACVLEVPAAQGSGADASTPPTALHGVAYIAIGVMQ